MKHLILIIAFYLIPSSETNIAKFDIEITADKKAVKLVCTSGCDWDSAEILLKKKPAQRTYITNVGLNFNDMKPNATPIFEIDFETSKNKNTITLIGKQGTAWETLEFAINENQRYDLNQFGITRK